MPINLTKGQKVDLTKSRPQLNRVQVGLGWDAATGGQSKGGFWGQIFGFDCDASVIMLKEGKKDKELIYFGGKKSRCKSVIHMGDNLTGSGDGDDEVINIDLKKLPADCQRLIFVVNIFGAKSRKQHFGMIRNAYIRVVNPTNNEELIHYDLTENYQGQVSLIAGELYRNGNDWNFAAIGEGTQDHDIHKLYNKY